MRGRKRKPEKKPKTLEGTLVPRSESDWMARPLGVFSDLQERMNQFFKFPFFEEMGRLTERGYAPRIDIYDEGKTLVVKAEIPGAKKEEIALSVSEDFLAIRGERKQAREEKRRDFYRSECAYGSFQRSVTLPHRVKAKGAKAKYENGILEIRLPKIKGEGSKSAEIKVE